MAENTGNFISKFAPKSHFFTDPAAISQSAGQAFGPVSSSEFRVTTSFTVSGDSRMAYAICPGVVLVQPQGDGSTAVNVIMRPFTQPIQGFNIKYFIYRGLDRDDFFTGNKVNPAGTGASDFINSINASFASYHNSIDPGSPLPDFMASFIGFDPDHQPSTLPLSDFFFKESQYVESGGEFNESSPFELPNVPMGASLGNFLEDDCGIDIVLDYGDYKLPLPNDEFVFDLAYARLPECSIMATDPDAFKQKVVKEQIFQFLDAAAYFGFHAIDTGAVTMNIDGMKAVKKGQDIYDLMVSKFATKNRLYLYIQSDRTRSYNFYGNYAIADNNTNSLKYGITENTLVEHPYENNGWPLLIDETPQDHSDDLNTFYLQLVTDNNVNTMLYGRVAQVSNAQSNNFCGPDNLKLPTSEDGFVSPFTKVLTIVNPATGLSNSKVNIAVFNLLLYEGKIYQYVAGQNIDEDGVTADILVQPTFFDDVFGKLGSLSLMANGSTVNYSIVTEQKLKLINHYFDKRQYGSTVVQTNVINDIIDTGDDLVSHLNRVTYITESIDSLSNVVSLDHSVSKSTVSSSSLTSDNQSATFSLFRPYYYTIKLFTDETQTITGLELKTLDNTVPDRIILGIAKLENTSLLNLISVNSIINPRLVLVDFFKTDNQLRSIDSVYYQKYKAGIVGEKPNGELTLFTPTEDIIVFSIDRLFYFTRSYSQYMKETKVNDLTLVLGNNLDLVE